MGLQIGDRIRVRKFADMDRDFGSFGEGDDACIGTPAGFVASMCRFCGRVGTVTTVYPVTDVQYIRLKLDETDDESDYTWDEHMVELLASKYPTNRK